MSAHVDVHTRITNQIIAQMEAGVRPWQKSWSSGTAGPRPRRATGERYRGVNTILLWMAAAAGGYQADTWMTYRQAAELGAQVRKGEKGSMVVYASTVERREPAGEEADAEPGHGKRFGFLKSYTVFNVEQIDRLPERFQFKPQAAAPRNPDARDEAAEAFLAATGATIHHGGGRAFYAPGPDLVIYLNSQAVSPTVH